MWHGHPHHGTRFRWSQHIPTNDEQCAPPPTCGLVRPLWHHKVRPNWSNQEGSSPRKKRRNCCVWWLTESSMASLASNNKKSRMNSNRRRRYVSWGVWQTRYPNIDCVRFYQMRIHTKISKRSSYEIMMIYECCHPYLHSSPSTTLENTPHGWKQLIRWEAKHSNMVVYRSGNWMQHIRSCVRV
jgi:hypothetical protein